LLGAVERFERLFVAIHDAQCGGDAEVRGAVARLIDREIQRFAIRGQSIVRAPKLQQQIAEQAAAVMQ